MTKDELEKLKIGDHIWLCDIQLSSNMERLSHAIFAEVEYIEPKSRILGRYAFEVVKKISGSLKPGDRVISGIKFNRYKFFKTHKEAIEEWNRLIYNALDYNQSRYEEVKKRFTNKIIKNNDNRN